MCEGGPYLQCWNWGESQITKRVEGPDQKEPEWERNAWNMYVCKERRMRKQYLRWEAGRSKKLLNGWKEESQTWDWWVNERTGRMRLVMRCGTGLQPLRPQSSTPSDLEASSWGDPGHEHSPETIYVLTGFWPTPRPFSTPPCPVSVLPVCFETMLSPASEKKTFEANDNGYFNFTH